MQKTINNNVNKVNDNINNVNNSSSISSNDTTSTINNINSKPLDSFEIRLEELTPDMQLLAGVCGLSAVRQLLQSLPGTMFYIPQISHFTKFMQRYISENNFKHQKQLAIELGVSERFIQKLKNGY